ncbi:MAG: phosphonoacetate hydrolase [Myxococcota bacterium]
MIEVNGRKYRRPERPAAVICLDGCDPSYLDPLWRSADMPTLDRWMAQGFSAIAQAAMPTFTNPNNVSIVTGLPPSAHGISGNFFLDTETDQEVPMNEARFVRRPTILAALVEAGVKVASVTAKKKLSALIAPPAPGRSWAVEGASEEAIALVGRAAPDVYSADASLFVLDLGAQAIARGLAEVTYLSTTDYVQHKHAPGSPAAREFYRAIDARLQALEALGATVVLTADHGMNAKTDAAGAPNVRWLGSALDTAVGPGARVILPITDPYVVHHGSLGSAATVYLYGKDPGRARAALEGLPGVVEVLDRAAAAQKLELPVDRIGDLFVVADADTVLGTWPERHDLSHVQAGLRSHGGYAERAVPLISSRAAAMPGPLRNFDAFALALGLA